MSLVDSLIQFVSGSPKEGTPADVCPHCWGYEEYDGKIRTAVKEQRLDLEHPDGRAFIEAFTVKHIEGIRLVDDKGHKRCSNCGRSSH